MQSSEGNTPPEAQSPAQVQSPPPHTVVNTVRVERSVLCFAVGQIVIDVRQPCLRCAQWALAFALAVVAAAPAWAQTSTQPGTFQAVSRASFAGAWPFTVEQGTLSCYRGQGIVFNTGGKTYTINGTADSLGRSLGYTWQSVNPIWRDNPAVPGTKVPMGDLIKQGQTLCKPWP